MYVPSIIIGLLLGYSYWLSLLFVTKRASLYTQSKANNIIIITALSSFVRIALFAGIFYYLLRQTNLHPILILLVFLSSFWLLLLLKKD
jgi:hypothetical protein